MNDKQCVLCEFTNEDDSVAVGYREWLLPTADDKQLDHIIGSGEEVKLQWPSVNIGPASVMKNRVKKCTWQTVVAKILAGGDWKTMCGMRDNLEKYSILEPSKEDRKFIKRKSTDIEDDKNSADSPPTHSATQKSHTNKKQKSAQSRKAGPSTIGFKSSSKTVQACKFTKPSKIMSDTSSDEEDLTKTELLQKISCLQEENKQLKSKDKKRKRTMDAMMDDLTAAAALSKKLKENLQSIDDIRSVNVNLDAIPKKTIETNVQKQKTLATEILKSTENIEHSVPKPKVAQSDIRNESFGIEFVKKETDFPDQKGESHNQSNEVTKTDGLETDDDFRAKHMVKKNDDANEHVIQLGQDHKESIKEKDVPDNSQRILEEKQKEVIEQKIGDCKENLPEETKEELQNLGDTGVAVSSKRLNNCNHATATKLTTDLLSLVFTKKELATSSMTGKVGNMHLAKGTNAKMQLDVAKVAAVKAYVKSKFPTIEKLESVIKKAIQQKCCNAAKSMKLMSNTNNTTPKE